MILINYYNLKVFFSFNILLAKEIYICIFKKISHEEKLYFFDLYFLGLELKYI